MATKKRAINPFRGKVPEHFLTRPGGMKTATEAVSNGDDLGSKVAARLIAKERGEYPNPIMTPYGTFSLAANADGHDNIVVTLCFRNSTNLYLTGPHFSREEAISRVVDSLIERQRAMLLQWFRLNKEIGNVNQKTKS